MYLLQVQAKSLIDIVVKAASAMGFEVEGYIDAGNKLVSAGLLSNEEFSRYRSVVRFRNNCGSSIWNYYGIIDVNIIRRIISNREYREVAKLGVKVVEELRRRGIDC
ncbi:HepT-like ribonuclease domain-containing protein [Vulcanisaeta moutnovskia]|uniref:HepT-like ribonuclease domain-containing protein n=1 Tax=Vulcanisaeta moutnovskia TaxID=985052 RepID=UPI00358FDA06